MGALLDMVAASLELTRKGNVWWTSCPFHAEKTSSFKIEYRRGKEKFHCFGCGASGDVVDWIQRTRNVTFAEAKRILGEERIKPDPALIEKRRQQAWRARILTRYHDNNPDCVCPDWLLATVSAPRGWKLPRPARARS